MRGLNRSMRGVLLQSLWRHASNRTKTEVGSRTIITNDGMATTFGFIAICAQRDEFHCWSQCRGDGDGERYWAVVVVNKGKQVARAGAGAENE